MSLMKIWNSRNHFEPQELLTELDGLDDETNVYFEEWDES
jgi:hypothetical protein